jgi:hypothetical protein
VVEPDLGIAADARRIDLGIGDGAQADMRRVGPSVGMPVCGQAPNAGVASAAPDVPNNVRRLIMKASPDFEEA